MDQKTSQAFEANVASVVEARRFVQRHAASWLTASDDLLLVTSELATNAIRHGGGGFELTLSRRGSEVTVEVRDQVKARPVARHPGVRSPSGRGLRIIDQLAQSWGVRVLPGEGKVVWARFANPDVPLTPDSA